jgi:ankyrin repeat protein
VRLFIIKYLIIFLLFISFYAFPNQNDVLSFMNAIYSQNREEIKNLLNSGIDINQKIDCTTPLLLAILIKDVEIVSLLINAGASVNSEGKLCYSPLILASSMGLTEIVHLLLKAHADVHEKDRWENTALYYAKKKNYSDIVKLLLQYGA